MDQRPDPGRGGGGRDIGGAFDVDTLKSAPSALVEDADQVDHLIGAVNGGRNLRRVCDVGGPGHDLTDVAVDFEEIGGLDIADGDTDAPAGVGQPLDQMTAQKTGAAENGYYGLIHGAAPVMAGVGRRLGAGPGKGGAGTSPAYGYRLTMSTRTPSTPVVNGG